MPVQGHRGAERPLAWHQFTFSAIPAGLILDDKIVIELPRPAAGIFRFTLDDGLFYNHYLFITR
jgi:hypothetical protein